MYKYQLKSKIDSSKVLSKYPEVQYYLKEIVKEFAPKLVIVFGSKARLDADSRSDCDFAIEAEGVIDNESIFGALDIIDIKEADSELLGQILNEGVVLYENKNI